MSRLRIRRPQAHRASTTRGSRRGHALGVFGLAALVSLLVLGPSHAASAATIEVTTTSDELNSDGDCSLREAIEAANTDGAISGCAAGSEADTVSLAEGTYAISIPRGTEPPEASENGTGDFDIKTDVVLTGSGSGTTVLDGSELDRVIQIGSISQVGPTVNISGVTITNGAAHSGNQFQGGGGVLSFGRLTLTDVSVRGNNSAVYGGGINNEGPFSTLALRNSTVAGNTARVGGGIANGFGAQEDLADSSVRDNVAVEVGGGIWDGGGDETSLISVEITGNRALNGSGGGVYGQGSFTLIVNQSTVSTNTAGMFGGGIYAETGEISVNDSTIDANSAQRGGGIYNFTGGSASVSRTTIDSNSASGVGGGVVNWEEMTISESTVSDNTGTLGGGIHHHTGTTTIENSTISGNQGSQGGGLIGHVAGSVSLKSTTVANNTAMEGPGGGIFKGMATIGLKDTIVANNGPADCDGQIASSGHNLDSDSSCSLGSPGDVAGVDPGLGSLVDNGGPTETHRLLAGSAAIDAASLDCPPTDQRGFARPEGAACDMGAVEVVWPTCGTDSDSDGLTDCVEEDIFATDPQNPDTDADGCKDGAEVFNSPQLGGGRNPAYFWDFYDTPQRDKVVSLVGDILGVAGRFGATGDPGGDPLAPPPPAPAYHTAFDRSGVLPGGDRWDLGAADGVITLPDDILGVAAQFGHNCS